MRAFAEAYTKEQIVTVPLSQLTRYHHTTLLQKVKDPIERLRYAARTIKNGRSRPTLVHRIETKLFERE